MLFVSNCVLAVLIASNCVLAVLIVSNCVLAVCYLCLIGGSLYEAACECVFHVAGLVMRKGVWTAQARTGTCMFCTLTSSSCILTSSSCILTSSSCILTSSSCILTSSSCILRRRELGHAGVPRLQSGEVDCAAVGAFLDGWDLHSDVDGEFPPYTDCSSPIY